jgi:hypothetical protein
VIGMDEATAIRASVVRLVRYIGVFCMVG